MKTIIEKSPFFDNRFSILKKWNDGYLSVEKIIRSSGMEYILVEQLPCGDWTVTFYCCDSYYLLDVYNSKTDAYKNANEYSDILDVPVVVSDPKNN